MKYHKKIFCITILSVLFLVSVSSAGHSKEQLLKVKSESLSILLQSMACLSEEISAAQKQLGSPEGLGREKLLREKIESLSRKQKDLNENFDLLATGVASGQSRENFESEFDWNRELKTLVGPVIQEIQDLTLRPREIEKLRSDIGRCRENILSADQAISNLNALISISAGRDVLSKKLNQTLKLWEDRKNEWEALNRIAETQLKLKSADASITKSIQDIPKIFFKSHGRNMLIAFFIFLMVTFIMFRLYGLIQKFSPIHTETRSFSGRLFDLGYAVFSVAGALISTLAVFYLFNDWVLLSVALIFIIGIAWASKQAFPSLWGQVKLILNLGPVKEGEVIFYKGLAYRVRSINLYTAIENPLIQGGLIKIPINDIMSLRSRPMIPDEPWFPTRPGDWVLIGKDMCGCVETQTPETVKLKQFGGAEIFYPTAEFLALSPLNLSSGFRLCVRFGIDYRYQEGITASIPDIFEAAVAGELADSDYGPWLKGLRTYFRAAAQSSLDLEIMADFDGEAGQFYPLLDGAVQKACVNLCNEKGWTIPFTQMVLHFDKE